MKNVGYYDFPIGVLGIAGDGAGITDIFFKNERTALSSAGAETPLLQEAARQLRDYFDGRRKVFNLLLSLHGTAFELADWQALRAIPYGETRSYSQIAEAVGRPKAARAVGMANHRNPVMIVVPCHRVIGRDGGLGGYAGGVDVKRYLLELEKKYSV